MRRLGHLTGALFLATVPAEGASEEPRLTVTVDPAAAVTVGTPVAITATVLVPTWMPEPPDWPDLQIADAITTLPARSTRPVTERVDGQSWSGVARTWRVVPQRAGDFDFGQPQMSLTWADPATGQPTAATIDLPDTAFSATIPAGAEGMDPFLAATEVRLTVSVDEMPAMPKPGDTFTMILEAEAAGAPAILLPPLAKRIDAPAGLRAYPRTPVIADGDIATRTEAITYVIEQPGTYTLAGVTLDWWNTSTGRRERVVTQPVTVAAEAPAPRLRPLRWISGALLVAGVLAGAVRWYVKQPPTALSLRRTLLRAARRDTPETVRRRLAAWQAVAGRPNPDDIGAIHAALRALDRTTYGPLGAADGTEVESRRRLVAAIASARLPARPRPAALPPLNPPAAPQEKRS